MDLNSCVNYPVKSFLIGMVENGSLKLDHPMIKFCVLWYSVHICKCWIGFIYPKMDKSSFT